MHLRLLVLLVTAGVFAQALWFGFVWDDNVLILENRLTDRLTSLPQFFTMDLWAATPTHHEAPYYRPLVLVDFTLDRVLFGLSPAAHHLHSILWHLASVWLLGGLLRRLVDDERAAAVGMAVFALHPAQLESVVFVSARNDPMAVVCVLGMLLLLSRDEPSPGHLLGGGLCMLAAALCKESVLLAPLLLLAVEWARTGRPGRLKAHLSVLAGIGAYAVLRRMADVGTPARADADHILAAIPPVLAHYAHRLLLPLDAAPGMHLAWPPAAPWAALLAGALLAGLLLAAGRRVAAAGVGIGALTLAPAVAAIAHTGAVPDRYLYLPVCGLSLAVAAALRGRPGWTGLGAGAGVLLVMLSARALPVWSDDLTLWSAALQRWPSPYTAGSLAKVLDDLGRLDEAAALYEQATAPPQVLQESCYNVTNVHFRRGDAAGIVRAGEAALAAGCDESPELLAPLAFGYLMTCDAASARETASRIASDPTGMAVIVRVAEGMLRGDDGPLQAAIADNPDHDPTDLIAQAERLRLAASGCSTAGPPSAPE